MIYELGPRGRRVYDTLRSRILGGVLAPGSKLKAATDLAEEFGVAPMTVRHALARLEAEGLIAREYGRGTFVRTRTPPAILVVTTKPALLTSLRKALTRLEYRVIEASTHEQAAQLLERDSSITMVVSAVRMPDPADGIAFIRAIRRRWPELPLVAITSDASDLAELYSLREWPVLIIQEPVRPQHLEEAIRLGLRPAESSSRPTRAVVLVADDDPDVRTALRLVLESLDCEVEEAAEMKETLAALRRRHFGHVFLDLRMPGGGVDSAKEIARMYPSTAVVVTTGFPQDILRESAGLFTVLQKPVAIEAVEAALRLRRVPLHGG